jgi:putative transposase
MVSAIMNVCVSPISSNSRLKVELIYAELYASIEAVRSGIFEYIEIFYNRKRRYYALGNISPAEFERR